MRAAGSPNRGAVSLNQMRRISRRVRVGEGGKTIKMDRRRFSATLYDTFALTPSVPSRILLKVYYT